MRQIGLTGSIGSGKSTVAQLLRDQGITVLDADGFAREGSRVLQAEICAVFPEVCASGQIDRAALGQLVFAQPESRKRLESILHPYVRGRMREETAKAEAAGQSLIVQDIPLLFETGRELDFTGVLVVLAPTLERLKRVQARSGLSEADFAARDAQQMPQEEKAKRANWVIQNETGLEELRSKVLAWLEGVRS